MFQYLQQVLSDDPGLMEQFQAPAKRSFYEETLPGIAERFTGMGAQRSSGFAQQLGSAGAKFEEGQAAQRAGLKGDAITQLLQMFKGGMEPAFNTNVTEPTSGFAQQIPQMVLTLLSLL